MTQTEGTIDRLLERIRELARVQADATGAPAGDFAGDPTEPPAYAHQRFKDGDSPQTLPAPVANPLQPRLLELTVPELEYDAFLKQAYRLLLGRSITAEEIERQQQPRIRNAPRSYRVAMIARSPEAVGYVGRTGLTVPELQPLSRWLDRIEALGPAARVGHLALRLTLKAQQWLDRKSTLRHAREQRREVQMAQQWTRLVRDLPGLFLDIEGLIDRVAQLESDRARFEQQLRHEYAGFRAEMRSSAQAQPSLLGAGGAELDAFYLEFERAFRGPEAAVEQHLEDYAPQLRQALQAGRLALDLGCGRGEWLRVLQRHGFDAQGIDASPAMVAACRGYGLRAEEGDALAALAAAPPNSHALISAFHLAEHLEFAALFALVAQAARALQPGGVLILETPNPENVLVGSHTFYHDPTHRNPLTPGAMAFLLGYHGLEAVEVLRFNPYPPEARVPGTGFIIERWNGAFCGPTDFAVVGVKPDGATRAETRSAPTLAEDAAEASP